MREDDEVTGAEAVDVMDFATTQYLCIMVDPDDEEGMRIPETSAYTAMGDYMTIEDGAIPPMPMMQTLGRIERDGTTVRFPYLTTREGYVQRIRIVNRGGEAKYTLDYASNAEAVAGTDEGVLEPDERKVLVVRDVVKVTDGSTTTAGTLIVEAEPRTIDVATTVNTADGGIDTVVYPSAQQLRKNSGRVVHLLRQQRSRSGKEGLRPFFSFWTVEHGPLGC